MSTIAPCRKNRNRQPAPPRPSGRGDELDRTARQVRLDGRDDSPVHDVAASWVDPQVGVTYRTYCDHVMTKDQGAILTTRGSTCVPCWRGGQ